MDYTLRYKKWLESDVIERETRLELDSIRDNPQEIKDRFYKELEFGTAGLRGKLGAGDNRMNEYNVARVTQGLADYIKSKGKAARERGVVIAYDVRHKSRDFAEIAAAVLAGNDIKVYLFKGVRPTPELSFSILQLSAISGIMITASHNPREYNGYKLYWEDGAQILPETAVEIYERIEKIELFSGVRTIPLKKALSDGLVKLVGEELDELYISKVKSLSLRDSAAEIDKNIRVVYTPLNGTGSVFVRQILRERGFKNVFVVPEQEKPDPDFTTVGYPNPEDKRAFKLAIKLAEKVNADIILATDPDADRLAVMVKRGDEYVALNGNQTGALLVYYLLLSMKEKDLLPENGFIVKSIVTGELAKTIADDFGVKTYEALTGFKNICGKALEIAESGEGSFLFGYEESIGYVTGDFVRDKDAVSSSMLVCEMAAYFFKNDQTLIDVLDKLFEKFGFFAEKQVSITLEGLSGQERIRRMMNAYRENFPTRLDGVEIDSYIDYLSGQRTTSSGEVERVEIPEANVIKFIFSDGTWYALRPSGTEPKIKLYIYSTGRNAESVKKRIEVFEKSIVDRLNSIA